MEFEVGRVGYAGLELNRAEGPAPAREPRFFHKEDRAGESGGSPRLVMVFTDGGNIQLRPDQWSTNWQS